MLLITKWHTKTDFPPRCYVFLSCDEGLLYCHKRLSICFCDSSLLVISCGPYLHNNIPLSWLFCPPGDKTLNLFEYGVFISWTLPYHHDPAVLTTPSYLPSPPQPMNIYIFSYKWFLFTKHFSDHHLATSHSLTAWLMDWRSFSLNAFNWLSNTKEWFPVNALLFIQW